MPFLEPEGPTFATSVAPEKEPPPAPTWSETFEAAFSLENDVANAIELANKPTFPEDPSFDWIEKLKSSPYWEDYRDNFIGTKSEAEMNYRIGQIEEERKQRETLSRAGFGGTVAAIAAGAVSPTILLPFVGEERGLMAFLQGAKWGLVGGTLQELPLMANQETRTWQDAAVSIGSSTILSGALGGAVQMLRRGEFERIANDMDVRQGRVTISTQSAGSAATRAESAGGLDVGPGKIAGVTARVLDSNAITRSPVTVNLMGISDQAKYLQAQYADGGMSLEGNLRGIPTTPGGTIENAMKLWNYNYEKAVRAVDDNYREYFFGNKAPKVGANPLATVMGHFSREYMSKNEFRQEISKALYSGDVHENPFVAAASKRIRAEFFDPTEKEAKAQGLLTGVQTQDASYLRRLYNVEAIRANRKNASGQGFRELLATRFQEKLEADFAERLGRLETSQAHREELITDVQRPEKEVEALRKAFLDELKTLDEATPETEAFDEDVVASLRAQAREVDASTLAGRDRKRQLLADARDMEKNLGPMAVERKVRRAELRRRIRNLNKAQVALEKKHARKLEKIERAEELSTNGLMRLTKKANKIYSEMENWTDEKLDAELSKLKSEFAETARLYDKAEEKISTLVEEESKTSGEANWLADLGFTRARGEKEAAAFDVREQGMVQEGRQEVRSLRMSRLSEEIADAEDLGRPAVRDLLQNMVQESAARIQDINARRAVRTERLRAQVEKLTPEDLDARIKGLRNEGVEQVSSFNDSIRKLGAESIDIAGRTADFTRYAKEQADIVANKIMGTYLRLPAIEVLQDKRGPELARVLDLPTGDLAPWLETDIEKILRSHIMTLAPDIEIARKFGTVNMDEILAPMWDEMEAAKEALASPNWGKKVKDGEIIEPATEAEKAKLEKKRERATRELDDKYQSYKDNLIAVHEKLRHTWGLPKDPDGIGYRLGRTVANLNVLRYMGSVTVSSIPDMAQPILKYGLGRVFKDAFIPLITNIKGFKASAREARYAGVANDALLNLRAQTVLDITDDLRRGSKFERGVEYLSNRQGIIAVFNHWTDWMKQFSGVAANAQLMDSLGRVVTKQDKKSLAYLASVGIGEGDAHRIWDAASRAGGTQKVDGVWLPNTEAWDDAQALRYYRSALAREVDRTIVTPGVERPNWTNATLTGRLLSQFKSFAFSSTYRTLLSGMQQRDANFVQGVMGSLVFGALSYYLYAITAGGKPYDDMQNAGWERWADESIQRSGLLAVFGLGQDLLSRIPATSPYSSFSGARTTRRGGDDLLETIAGPTYGDFVQRVGDILTEIDDPTTSTQHKFRALVPFQNLFWLRQLFDAVEQSNPLNLPERRGQ